MPVQNTESTPEMVNNGEPLSYCEAWIAKSCNIYTVVLLSQFVNKTYQHYECTPERRVDPIRPRLHL